MVLDSVDSVIVPSQSFHSLCWLSWEWETALNISCTCYSSPYQAIELPIKTVPTLPLLDLAIMDYKYSRIDEERDEARRAQWSLWWLWRANFIGAVLLGATLIAALSSLATVGVINMTSRTSSTESELPKQYSCGESFDEAHQRGCKFDSLSLTWLHPKCSQYGQEEFHNSGVTSNDTWEYWEKKGGGHVIGGYEAVALLAPGSFYWTTQEHHLYHCVWMLRRIHDAAVNPGKRLDAESSSAEHAKHCVDMLGKWAAVGVADTLTDITIKGVAMDIGMNAC